MAYMMMPIPPIHGPVTSTVGMLWGLVAFVLVLFLLVILWVVWTVRNQHRAAHRLSQMKEAEWHYEASPQSQGGEQPQIPAPEEEKTLLRW
jgi:uncharacterized membrane protein